MVLTLLYFADLYGNDEPEFAVPTEPAEEPVKSESSENNETLKEASPPPKASPSGPAPTSTAETTTAEQYDSDYNDTNDQHQSNNAPASQSQVPVYTSPATQQIPTYQERQDSDYPEMAPQHTDSAYVPLDRPVRPSEMKEEGLVFILRVPG